MNDLLESSANLLVLSNVPDEETAAKIARHLVEQRLVSCVNILPAVRSIYRWQNVVEETVEVTLLIKTVRSCYAEVESAIKSMHPYDVPEIIALSIAEGSPAYLEWIAKTIKG
jgi:periplasmic divalent cation tolerance protein